MDKKNPAAFLFTLFLGLAISVFVIKGNFSPQILGILVFCIIFIPTLIKPDIGFIILIVSMLFSPEVIAGTTTRRAISIRTEDIMLLVVILAWLLRTALNKNIAGAFRMKMTKPLFSYIAICICSTLFAALSGGIDVKHSFFSILKYLEYFVLFVMVKDNLKKMRQVKVMMAVFFLTALLVAVSSHFSIQHKIALGEHFFRLGPPVETRGGGESGTLGGYLLFMMAIAGGFLMYEKSTLKKTFLVVLELLMLRALLYTLSRGSYLALAAIPILFVSLAKKRRIILFYTLGIITLLTVIFMPKMVNERISSTIMMKENAAGSSYVEWEDSPKERLASWKNVIFEKFPKSPLFGHGVGRFFIDSQIFTTLSEVGLIGLSIFIWVLFTLFRMAQDTLNTDVVYNDAFGSGLTTGFLVGFIALLIHSISCNTFIIISIMEPFWFIAAIVLSLPRLLKQGEGLDVVE